MIRTLDDAQVQKMGSAARFYVANGPRFTKGLKRIGLSSACLRRLSRASDRTCDLLVARGPQRMLVAAVLSTDWLRPGCFCARRVRPLQKHRDRSS